ncbi:unnamed protein product, partial [Ectocarpus fasciculatus]
MDIQSVRRYVGTGHGSYTFVVHATDREMLLRADSANDESRWIRGLTLQTDLLHGGTFQGPPSAKNRRQAVLKLMGEGCTEGNGGDGRGGDNKTTGWDQSGGRGGGKNGEGEWKGEGSQFREINKKIRALMNDHDNRAGSSSTAAAGNNSTPTRFYTERQPAQKFKITPRDPRGISIVGGSGLGKFPEKNGGGGGGGGDNGSGARRFSTKVVPISEPPTTRSCASQQESLGGGGGGSGSGGGSVNEASRNVSSTSTISSRSSGSNSPEDGRWTVVTGVGARGGSSGGGSGSGRSKPPMPSGPPPTNARGVRAAKLATGGDHGALSDTASSDEKDDVRGHWRSRSRVVARRGSGARRSKKHRYSAGGDGDGDDGGRHGSFSHRGAWRNAGGAGGRRGRNDFESLDDVSSSSSRTRGDPFMDDYVTSAEMGRGGSTPRDHPSGAPNRSSTTAAHRRERRERDVSTSVSGSSTGEGDAVDTDQYHRYPQKKQQQHHHHRYGRRQRPRRDDE